jgi:hypothetical protein
MSDYIEKSDIKSLLKGGRNIVIAGLIHPRRPGVFLFIRTLELQEYPPGSPSNDNFECALYKLDENIVEVLVSIPSQDYAMALRHATKCSLKMRLGDNLLLTDTEILHTGIPDGRIYVLENTPGHAVYSANQKQLKELLDSEDKLISLEEQRYEYVMQQSTSSF